MLDYANSLLNSSKKDQLKKSYNSFKTLYIRSILENNIELKKEALSGLIKSSKKLGLDCKKYEEELYGLISKNRKKVDFDKKLRKKEIVKDNKNRLKKIVLKKRKIEFIFEKKLRKDDIKTFDLNYKNIKKYKKVFDIKATWPYSKREYKLKTIDRLKIAQFDKNILRAVFEDDSPLKISYKVEKNILTFYLKGSSKADKKFKKSVPIYKKAFTKNRVIVIDPGHGGSDPGAIGYKRKKEKDAVLAISKKVYKELKNRGYKVYLTRTKDYFVKLRNRTKYANIKMADIFISIHANAAPKKSKYLSMRGIETFFLSPARSQRAKRVAALENRADISSMGYFSKQTFLNFLNREKIIASNKLAIDIQKGVLYNLRKHFKDVVDNGVREGPFWVLVGAQMPAILIEVGYITNPTEAKRLFNPYYQNLIAKGIADGIDSYFLHNP